MPASSSTRWVRSSPVSEGFTVLFFRRRYLEDWKESLELGAFSAAAAMVPAAEGRFAACCPGR